MQSQTNNIQTKTITIALVGGGSGGSVSPLLAVSEELKKRDTNLRFLFIGGGSGPEAIMAANHAIPFIKIPESKLRRYFTFRNLWTPVTLTISFFKSLRILKQHRPSLIFGTGSFFQVPVAWAAKVLGIPVILHQQDVIRTLSNILCAPTAHTITVTFKQSLADFPSHIGLVKNKSGANIVCTGNPSKLKPLNSPRQEAVQFFGLDTSLPTVLIMGGGTGAIFINDMVAKSFAELNKFVNVIHISGKGKGGNIRDTHYYRTEFLQEMDLAYHAADIVVSRAGLSSITELSVFAKPSIIIPIPGTHQEANAQLLSDQSAALILHQKELTPSMFIKAIRTLLFHGEAQKALAEGISEIMPHDADKKIATIILDILHHVN